MDQRTPVTSTNPVSKGYLYLLYNGVEHVSKIGCSTTSNRPETIMRGSSSVLAHVLSAQVEDYLAAEAQCLQHFDAFKSSKWKGWLDVSPEQIVEHMYNQVHWLNIKSMSLGSLLQYRHFCRLGDMARAADALTRDEVLEL